MHQPGDPLRIAIGQLRMRWTCEENSAAMQRAMHLAADAGAAICVFPELAVTGFHRQIKSQAEPVRVQESLDALRKVCSERAIALAAGAPTFASEGRIHNSHVHVDERGNIAAVVPKIGLTDSERTFFAAGHSRPVSQLCGVACTSVLCREVEDLDALRRQVPAGRVHLTFWPSLVGRPPAPSPDQEEVAYLPLAQRLAAQSRSWVVQSNWPNSLNYPEESSHAGESAVIAPDGHALLRLPRAEAGLAVFTLGESSYAWFREEA